MSLDPGDPPDAKPCQGDHLDHPPSTDAPEPTAAEVVGAVLRTFPGSYITGTRLLDPAECPDVATP